MVADVRLFFNLTCCTLLLCAAMIFSKHGTSDFTTCQQDSSQNIHSLKTRALTFEDDDVIVNPEISSININQTSSKFKGIQTFNNERSRVSEKQSTVVDGNRKKITHISFLKVHKASSTTMQNIFFRFGIKNNLNILLPKKGNYLWRKMDQMQIKKPNHYDIFACHTVYSKTFFDSLLPSDAVKIGIVREPIDRMISAAYYFRDVWHKPYLARVPRAGFIHNLVKYPDKYEPTYFSNTRNAMAKDFGFPPKFKPTHSQEISNYLKRLNSQFLLVLSVEKIDESLVLMKRLLGWELSEILYVTKNKHKHAPVVLSAYEKSKFRKTSFLDFKIYEYFTEVLNEKLNEMPSEFWEEVNYFKTIRKRVNIFCADSNKEPRLEIAKTNWNNQFSLYKNDCTLMSTNELAFIAKLRARHQRRFQNH